MRLFLILSTLIISSLGSIRASFNNPLIQKNEIQTSIKNDCDVSKWVHSNEESISVAPNGTDTKGLELKSSAAYSSFEYTYSNTLIFDDINVDFTFVDTEFDYSKNHSLFFIISDSFNDICEFNFKFKHTNNEKTYDVSFKAGSVTKNLSSMKCNEDGHIQFKIAYESVMDRETGETVNVWNYVMGIPKTLYSTSNDKFSNVSNKTTDGSFSALDSYFLQYKGKDCKLKIKGTTELGESLKFVITQVCDYRFYNTVVLPNSLISVSKVTYTDISFSYTVPDLGIDYKGFFIKRFINGNLDEKTLYTSKTAVSKNDSYLKQNSTYEYKIYAVSNVSSTGRIACKRIPIEFETLEVVTKKGDIKYLITGVTIGLALIVGFVLLYVYWYDLKKVFKVCEK